MKVLVVGAGLMGSAIANRFAKQGDSVTVLSSRPNPLLSDLVSFAHGRVELGSYLGEIFGGVDIVVDAASSLVPATVEESPATAMAASVGVSSWLAEQAIGSGVSCLVFLSSGGTVYGDGNFPHLENELPNPISAYGAMKVATEYAVAAITRRTPTRTVNLRIANAYGPGQNLARPQGIIGIAWRNHLSGIPTTMYGARCTVRDFVYVDDVGDLCVAAANSDIRGAVNAGSGRGISLEDVLETMSEVSGAPLTIVHQGARGFDVPRSVLDIGVARSLGWQPTVSLRDGLTRTWAWINDTYK